LVAAAVAAPLPAVAPAAVLALEAAADLPWAELAALAEAASLELVAARKVEVVEAAVRRRAPSWSLPNPRPAGLR
jgi:hypothetical protein